MKSSRTTAILVVTAALTTTVAFAVEPADARVASRNDQFCSVLSSDQGAGINFDGLGVAEARLAANVMRKAAKAGVPAKLKKDLLSIATIYDRIASGEPAAEVLDAKQQRAILPGLTRFGKYLAANCIATPGS